MFKFGLLLTFALFPFMAASAAPGFEGGDHYQAHSLRGSVNVICPDRQAFFSCQDYYLEPSMRDYFVYQNAPQSDRVSLTAEHEDGRTRTRSEGFNNGRSTSSFNLWISTLFQRPLLATGHNRITYQMQNNSQVVEEGEFDVFVERRPTRSCPHRTYRSSSNFDCQGGGATICARYFYESRNCR